METEQRVCQRFFCDFLGSFPHSDPHWMRRGEAPMQIWGAFARLRISGNVAEHLR